MTGTQAAPEVAYEQSLATTATERAPRYVRPADQKHVMQAMAASILVDTIETLDLQWPTVSEDAHRRNAGACRTLEAERD